LKEVANVDDGTSAAEVPSRSAARTWVKDTVAFALIRVRMTS
jgi:hypothetical protein